LKYYLIILNVVLIIWIFVFFRSTQLRYNSAVAHRIGESNYFFVFNLWLCEWICENSIQDL